MVEFYNIDTKIPLTHTLSLKGRGKYPSFDFVASLRRDHSIGLTTRSQTNAQSNDVRD
jgi:hypothetical protein